MPSITVVIPTRNRPDLVSRAARSVLRQTGVDANLVIVDDGSSDGSLERLRELELREPTVTVLAQQRRGAASARNLGAVAATGDTLVFLDSDDELTPGALQKFNLPFTHNDAMVQTASGPKHVVGVGAVCAAAETVDEQGRRVNIMRPRPLGPAYENARGLFLAGAFVVRREVFLELSGFAERCRSSQHTEFALRLVPYLHEHDLQLAAIDEPTVTIHQHAGAHLRGNLENLLEGALYIVRNHERQIKKSPKYYSDWCTAAAVYAAKQRRWSLARSLLWKSMAVYPQKRGNYARLLLSCCPPLARRVWRPDSIV